MATRLLMAILRSTPGASLSAASHRNAASADAHRPGSRPKPTGPADQATARGASRCEKRAIGAGTALGAGVFTALARGLAELRAPLATARARPGKVSRKR